MTKPKPGSVWTQDNLLMMRWMDSASVDMIYTDPPFNSKRFYNDVFDDSEIAFEDRWDLNTRRKGELAELQATNFPLWHIIESARIGGGDSTGAYLTFMALRMIEMWRVLKPTGHLFLHCDDSAGHWLKVMMDVIAGKGAFRNHITWKRSSTGNDAERRFRRDADYIIYYAKPESEFRPIFDPHSEEYIRRSYRHDDEDGRGLYRLDNLAKPKGSPGYHYEWHGYSAPANGWRCPERTMQEHHDAGLLHYPVDRHGNPLHERRIAFKRFLSTSEGVKRGTVWTVHSADQDPVYPTSKPVPLIRDLIRATTRRGEIVFDPFCGCASTFIAADELQREWFGCDISEVALRTLLERMDGAGTFLRPHRGEGALSRSPEQSPKWTKEYAARMKAILLQREEEVCRICWKEKDAEDLTLDHILSRHRGGGNGIENLQLACGSCNSKKGAKSLDEYMLHLMEKDPRRYAEIVGRQAAWFERRK